jgi:multiple sugar transport system permease protein
MAYTVAHRRRLTTKQRQTITGWLFISPAVLGFLIWTAGPMVASLALSLSKWDLIRPPRFVGLANFGRMLADDLFWQSLRVTLYYTVFHVPLALIVALGIALLLNAEARGRSIFRTLYYLPTIVPAVATAVMWVWIFNSEFGLLNTALRAIGLPKILWLQDPRWAMPAIITMSLWSTGATMVIFLAGLQGVPEQLYEAAEIDGAGTLARFWYVTVPIISPIIFFNLVMQVIGSFQVFTAGYIMTAGGPANSTLFYVLYLFRNAFQYFEMGYAASLAWVLFLLILGLSVFIFRTYARSVYEEGGEA